MDLASDLKRKKKSAQTRQQMDAGIANGEKAELVAKVFIIPISGTRRLKARCISDIVL